MAFIVDDEGNITLRQGDSGELVITGIPTDKVYSVYFGIQNENRQAIGSEISVTASYTDTVTIFVTPSLTDLLTVPKSEEYATYYYGIKICEDDGITPYEDTLVIGDKDIGDLNTITVYPKIVEGLT